MSDIGALLHSKRILVQFSIRRRSGAPQMYFNIAGLFADMSDRLANLRFGNAQLFGPRSTHQRISGDNA
nr:hypothetical protein [Roseateles aquatilis]